MKILFEIKILYNLHQVPQVNCKTVHSLDPEPSVFGKLLKKLSGTNCIGFPPSSRETNSGA